MQGILGTSLNKPLFYVKKNEQDNTLSIFFGFSLLTTIPDKKNSYAYRSAIGMLVNAGVCKRHIKKSFGLAWETIEKTADIFNTAVDDIDLINKLKFPGRPDEITTDISSFIHKRTSFHKANGEYRYIKKTLIDIQKKYNRKFSRETIRLELKKLGNHTPRKPKKIKRIDAPLAETTHSYSIQNIENGQIEKLRNQYAGLFLFSYQLSLIFNDFPNIKTSDKKYFLKDIFMLLILDVLLGGKNIEHFRYINKNDFEFVSRFFNIPCVEVLRNILYETSLLEDTKYSTLILKKNIDYFIEEDNTYYLDPHVEEYTGKAKIPKGWNTIKNKACKNTVDYYVHDGAGNPVFSLLYDHFYDFRDIIVKLLQKIKKLRRDKEIILVYDRGGFSVDLMDYISNKKDRYFITWQKGFKQDDANSIEFTDSFMIESPYNTLGNFKILKYCFGEDEWEYNDYKCRRLVFCKKNDPANFCQSVLTNHNDLDGAIVIKKILARSLQENDFKKQKTHHGLDEITGYRKLPYGSLNDKGPNKKIMNPKYRDLLDEIQSLLEKKNKSIEKIGKKTYRSFQRGKISHKLSKKDKSLLNNILKLDSELEEKKKLKKVIPQKISKLEKYKQENKVELDLRPKKLFGLLKMTSRNIFNYSAKEFLETYRNLRDYNKVFRKLVRSGGEIEIVNNSLTIKLDSFGSNNFKKKINEYLEKMNKQKIYTTDGKYILNFKLLN